MTTLLVYAPALAHDWPGHPEHAGRGPAIKRLLQREGVWDQMQLLEAPQANDEQLRRVHSQQLIDRVYHTQIRGGGFLNPDTYTTDESYHLARLAAGGCAAAVDAILEGRAGNGLAIVRPPGHHAERENIGGFCLFNNVAVAARQAQIVHGLERILVLDFDVHHGNGTQDIFYDDPGVYFISLHMYLPLYFYPGSGGSGEAGKDPAKGATLNIPLGPGIGDSGYCQLFDEVVLPAARRFQPQFILVSAGFDAHWKDPLAQENLSLAGYDYLVRSLLRLAEDCCDGRILFVLEGGYFEDALAYGTLNLANALLGHTDFKDPLGPSPVPEQEIGKLLQELKQRHLPY